MRARPPDAAAPDRPVVELAPERAARRERSPYAVVDIGSNSVRLVVYEELGRAPLPRFNEKSLCRLGEGLAATGMLQAQSMRRTVEAARRFRAITDAMGVVRTDVLATEATRRAANGGELVDAIRREAGLEVRVLSGDEEAFYGALGVVSGFFRPVGIVGDMGGGSLEIAEVRDDRPGDRSASLPLGSLPVQALLDETADKPDKAKASVDALLRDKLPPDPRGATFYAVGGGWRALAKAHIAASGSAVEVVHGHAVETGEMRAFAKRVLRLPAASLAKLPGMPTRRRATARAAALVLDRVLKHLAPERVVFSALGVREGWLHAQLPTEERHLDPLVEGAQLFGIPQARVAAFAAALADWTGSVCADETPARRRLRLAACAVSDIAWRDHVDLRAAESFRRLLDFPFIGIEHAERVFLAAAIHARYGGDHDDARLVPALALLGREERRDAEILGRLILLGYRLSGGVPEILAGARVRIGPESVRLEVGKAARVPESEVVADRLQLLAEAAGVARTEIVEVP